MALAWQAHAAHELAAAMQMAPLPEQHADSDWFGCPGALEDKYERMGVIGAGAFGTVHKAYNKMTGDLVAIKHLHLEEDLRDGVPAHVIREVSILRDFSHQNIVRLQDIYVDGIADYNLVFEYVDMDLHRVLRGHRRAGEVLPFQELQQYSQQLLSGCHACHVRLIIHRDLKPQNILVSREGLKICDFGLARIYTPPLKAYTHDVVTLWYRAPEILLGTQIYGPEVDIWAAGCIIAEMVSGSPTFPGDSEIGTIFKILKLLGSPTEEGWPGFSQLQHWKRTFPKWTPTGLDPILQERPELGPLGINLLQSLLQLNPQARLGARKAKNHAFFSQRVGQVPS